MSDDLAAKLAAMTLDQLTRRRDALSAYQLSMLRVGEQSDAADREHMRVATALSTLNSEIARRKR